MKVKFLFAAICALPLLAGAGVRVDLNGLQDGIKLRKTAGDFQLQKGHWLKGDQQDCYLYLTAKPAQEWTAEEFTFVPEKSGTVTIAFTGSWAEKPEDMAYFLVDDVTVNGEALPNGGFEDVADGKPAGWMPAKSPVVVDDAHSGSKAVKINHVNRVSQKITVEAGKPYTVKFFAKDMK